MKILDKLNEAGTTVIIITHNDEIAGKSKRVVRIHDGKIDSDTISKKKNLTYGDVNLRELPKTRTKKTEIKGEK